LYLTTDAEYVVNLVDVNNVVVNVQQCSLLNEYAIPVLHNDSFLTDIIAYDRLKFS